MVAALAGDDGGVNVVVVLVLILVLASVVLSATGGAKEE